MLKKGLKKNNNSSNSGNKKLMFGALSAVVASIATSVLVKKNKSKNEDSVKEIKVKKNKLNKEKNLYYTMNLNDIYDSYNDQTWSEQDMIDEIKRDTSL